MQMACTRKESARQPGAALSTDKQTLNVLSGTI